jgi:hypothetical protein
MTIQRRSTSSPEYGASYRVVVKARNQAAPKGFVWEIVYQGNEETLIDRSSKSFQTMEEAYDQGSVALRLLAKSE